MKARHIFLFLVLAVAVGYFALSTSNGPRIGQPKTVGAVIIGSTEYTVEIAKTDDERKRGLSGRDSLEAGYGMLFVFPKPDYYSFWMKDTKMPLDILWIHDEHIVDIKVDAEPSSSSQPPTVNPREAAEYVLEINGKDSEVYGFKVGDSVRMRF